MEEIVLKIEKLIIECGDIIKEANYSDLGIENKEGISNIVTKYDKQVQSKLKKELLEIIPSGVPFLYIYTAIYIIVPHNIDLIKNGSEKLQVETFDIALEYTSLSIVE